MCGCGQALQRAFHTALLHNMLRLVCSYQIASWLPFPCPLPSLNHTYPPVFLFAWVPPALLPPPPPCGSPA